LARELGFRGKLLGYLPAFGGVSWDAEHITQGISPSNRRVILIKGRDQGGGDPQGRALSIIKALSLCKDALKGYRIIIGAASPNVASEAETLSKETGLNIEIFQHLEYENWLKIMGTARVLLAATVTDGLPSTLVEAMSLGVLPIHSGLEPIREWIDDGKNGLLIQPDNIEGIAKSLRLALRDDGLVEQAAALNRAIVAEKLSFEAVKNKAIEMYEYVLSHGKTAG
jgi:glycosyltransferase involved in cell wall biosynthesis